MEDLNEFMRDLEAFVFKFLIQTLYVQYRRGDLVQREILGN